MRRMLTSQTYRFICLNTLYNISPNQFHLNLSFSVHSVCLLQREVQICLGSAGSSVHKHSPRQSSPLQYMPRGKTRIWGRKDSKEKLACRTLEDHGKILVPRTCLLKSSLPVDINEPAVGQGNGYNAVNTAFLVYSQVS